jgi:hypothetical protein
LNRRRLAGANKAGLQTDYTKMNAEMGCSLVCLGHLVMASISQASNNKSGRGLFAGARGEDSPRTLIQADKSSKGLAGKRHLFKSDDVMINIDGMGSEIVRACCPECGMINVRVACRGPRVQCIECGHVFWLVSAAIALQRAPIDKRKSRWSS